MKRTKLSDRTLPAYTRNEERMNIATHIVGSAIGTLALIACLCKTIPTGNALAIITAIIYCTSMILVYTVSSIYHSLKAGMGRKVVQVLDHCVIYLLIAGTYMPIALLAFRPSYPDIGLGLTIFQWATAALAIILTAIDLRKFRVFSMICYICCGWAVLPFMSLAREVLTPPGFRFLLWGGVVYTIGAILYGIGSKKKWFHSIFHIFVVAGSTLHLLCILFYVY